MTGVLCNPRYRRPDQGLETGAARSRVQRFVRDMIDGGDGQFVNPPNDPVTLNGQPYQARLRFFEERSGRLIREIWSDARGVWRVDHLNRNQCYLVVCYNGSYPPLAYHGQAPDPME